MEFTRVHHGLGKSTQCSTMDCASPPAHHMGVHQSPRRTEQAYPRSIMGRASQVGVPGVHSHTTMDWKSPPAHHVGLHQSPPRTEQLHPDTALESIVDRASPPALHYELGKSTQRSNLESPESTRAPSWTGQDHSRSMMESTGSTKD